MPVRKVKGGGYRYGKTGKTYYGKRAKAKADRQGRAIKASQNKRNYIGIDLNPEYLEITKRRIEKGIGNEKHEVSVR